MCRDNRYLTIITISYSFELQLIYYQFTLYIKFVFTSNNRVEYFKLRNIKDLYNVIIRLLTISV